MKKTLLLLVCLFFTFFLTACSIQTVEQYEKMNEEEQSIQTSTDEKEEQTEPVADTDIKDSNLEKENTAPEEKKKDTEKETVAKETKQQPTKESESKITTEKQEQTVTTKQETKTTDQSKPKTDEQSNLSTEQPQKKPTVTITIRVDTLLKNWDLLDPSLQSEKYVPKDGVILKTTTYELLSENDTVWDILQRATKEHKIQMEYQGANENIYNSVYVEGINHLYEFSAGPLSGWMYKVNGVFPNYGCSQYKLKDGDVIEWHYTVDLGRDLGHEWKGE